MDNEKRDKDITTSGFFGGAKVPPSMLIRFEKRFDSPQGRSTVFKNRDTIKRCRISRGTRWHIQFVISSYI